MAKNLVEKTKTLPWLLKRVALSEYPENRGYSAELLSILLQDNREIRITFGKADGVETVLKVLSVCPLSAYLPDVTHMEAALQDQRSRRC